LENFPALDFGNSADHHLGKKIKSQLNRRFIESIEKELNLGENYRSKFLHSTLANFILWSKLNKTLTF